MLHLLQLLVVTASVFVTTSAVDFVITNKDSGPIWIGIQGNPGFQHLKNGGFVLNKGQSQTVSAPNNWRGRFWSRTWCVNNHCGTGDCGNKIQCAGDGGAPPVTLIEITLRGAGGLDFYDISLVDGFNTRASIQPVGGQGDGGRYSCKKAQCGAGINEACPKELRLNNQKGVIGCKSACLAFNTDQYCCRGAHGTPQTCKSTDWPKNYPKFFKDKCPDAYSYAYDDHKSTFTCKANKYNLNFGNV